MRAVTYWLIGDRAGTVILSIWNWLWGKQIEQGGQVAAKVAQESLYTMQQSVHQLTQSVAKASAAYEQVKQQYTQKQADAKRSEWQAAQAFEQGQEDQARLAMARAIEGERVLPLIETQVKQAEHAVQHLKDKLNQERQKLESYRMQMQNLKVLAEVNEALAVIADVNSELKIDSARNLFEDAKTAIEVRNLQAHAFQELSENPLEKLQANLDQTTLDDEIKQRLLRLKTTRI
jgi:phage shock protein A